jgi:BirA family biotin operon repressor/biotin-[acetyl-CoA-carboxylase] ligase
MNQAQLEQALKNLPLGRLECHPTIGSTNDLAAQWAADQAPNFSLVVADEQTKGRGRSGRKWHTPPGAALAFSLVLRGEGLQPADVPRTAGLGALAVCEALLALGLEAQIKWPNDVLIKGEKVCGILAEAHWLGDHLQALILGIGVNITPEAVPPKEQLNFPATSVQTTLGKPVNRLEILKAVLENILKWWVKLETNTFIQAWETHLAYKNQPVTLVSGAESTVEGRILGLDQGGGLILALENGDKSIYQAGEIHLRPRVDRDTN